MRRTPLLVLLALALTACGGSSGKSAVTTNAAVPATQATPACRTVQKPKPKPNGARKAPTAPLPAGKTYTVRFETNCGTFAIGLNLKTAPRAAASFVALARSGFFDDTIFHRIVPGFVIQGGDPTGKGTGGPGYKTVDRPPSTATYTLGVVAMAKTQTEAPGTSGSQFFVVTGADVGLPPDYAVLGKITSGLDVVRKIGKLGDPTTEQPTQVVSIRHATVITK